MPTLTVMEFLYLHLHNCKKKSYYNKITGIAIKVIPVTV